LATHFSIFYRTFSRPSRRFHAQETGSKTETKSTIRGNASTATHNSPQTPSKAAISSHNPHKPKNRPQLPAKPAEKPQNLEVFRPSLHRPPSTF
jgi:hypothetical protein